MLYACDDKWWERYHAEVVESGFGGELWTQDNRSAQRFRLRRVQGAQGHGLGKSMVHWGGNSGYQCINLAYLWGALRIVLLGFDMQKTDGKAHWFGDHPKGLHKTSPYEQWVAKFGRLAADLSEEGVEVINATRETALRCFVRAPIGAVARDALQAG